MRHKSNELVNLLIPDQQPFAFKPRFSKHKNFYAKQPILQLHYVTPTQKQAKLILDKICHIDKKAIVNDRPESSFQKRKHFSVDLCFSSRPSFLQKKQIRIKSIQKPYFQSNVQPNQQDPISTDLQANLSTPLQISEKDWLAFVLE
ncbi:unnamed protein product (macronuclear) [Paramecium tetraurelia]|uniref:Uncharacterized protein n=1 Tax=Paramecium tetraurelia TaxID=5888 RepID=A0EGE5_PARTE|nr:uncharacterized protein GSPATT00026710001 [Paramecium tetraurelia]CAK94386.1 unnamed protein product [Paramecium tetraurelia]|eukprot:XP_001461759.1 hypothetical protein (macronuclear) [Paramecium tetraurelia strain d4-2]